MEKLYKTFSDIPKKNIKSFFEKHTQEDLYKLKLHLDDIYYNTGETEIPDWKYDILKEYIGDKSVGAKLREGDNRVNLPFWLGSADKITPEQGDVLARWIRDNKAPSYVITEKLDGVSCLIISERGQISIFTRGDGVVGADISYLSKYFIDTEFPEDIAFRGELIMKKDIFQKYLKEYKNPRNMVSGLISGKTKRKGLEDVDLIVYEIVGHNMPPQSEQLTDIQKLGLKTPKYEIVKNISIESLSKKFIEFKSNSQYEIDGIIVQANFEYDRNTSGNPDYMFAFKMLLEDSIYSTTVKGIEWNVSKWGQLKPVAILEPVDVNGITISRATAHNAKYVEENNLGKGSVIKITRSKDVIPYIISVDVSTSSEMPTQKYYWDDNHVNIFLDEYDDKICVKLVANFFSQLGIKHVSEMTVEKLFRNGLDSLLKIVGASKSRLLQVPEFGEKSADRIWSNIRNGLKDVKKSVVLGSSGVLGYGIGVKKIDALLLYIPNLFEIYKGKSKKELVDMIKGVEGFSDKTALKVAENLKYGDILLQKLSKYATYKTEKRVSDNMKGEKFVFTGFRDKKLEEDVGERGGKIVSSVSKNTTALIVAVKSGKLTGKLEKASNLGVPIYTKEEFIQKYLN